MKTQRDYFVLLAGVLLGMLLMGGIAAAQVWEEWVETYNYGAPGNDAASASDIAVDDSAFVYVTGESNHTNEDGSGDYATIKYDSNGIVQWIMRYNGPADLNDEPQALALDQHGNVYVTGWSYGTGTEADICTIKYGPDGSELWVTRYNGSANGPDMAYALAVDSLGNVYLAGRSDQDSSVAASYDLLVLKYDSLGAQQWVVLLNGPSDGDDAASDIALDSQGNIYVTGAYHTGSGLYFYDCLTAKYDAAGTLIWLDLVGELVFADWGEYICVDGLGSVYVSGLSEDGLYDDDILTIKYNETGVRQWIARYGPWVLHDYGSRGVASSPQGGVFVNGYRASGFTANRVLIKYTPLGELEWVSYTNSNGTPWDIAVDGIGNAYVTGSEASGYWGIATQRYNPGSLQFWSISYFGAFAQEHESYAIALDSNANVYIAGYTDLQPGSGADIAFLTIKYTQSCPITISMTPVSPPVQIPSSGGSFNFTAELSNNAQSPQTFDVWIMVQLPGGSWYGPALGPVELTLPGQGNLTRLRTQNVPGGAPAGIYTYRGYVGDYPAKWDSSSFTFEKSGFGIRDSGFGNWDNVGQSFDENDVAFITHSSSLITSVIPNPFNPVTAISYQLPANSYVSLRIYDTAGRRVATLVNGWREAGSYEETFDGSGLASGIYLYRLEAGNYSAVKKLILLK